MEKTIQRTKKITKNIHEFYCDECGILIGTSEEYDDGYYREHGEFKLEFYTPDGWYRLEKCLCNTCREKILDNIYVTLKSFEFKTRW